MRDDQDNGHEDHADDVRKARVWAAKENGRKPIPALERRIKLFDSRAIRPKPDQK